jgi:hypothetical protein
MELPATQITVTSNPAARGTTTERLPCLSDSVFVEAVMRTSRLSSAAACSVSVSTVPSVLLASVPLTTRVTPSLREKRFALSY